MTFAVAALWWLGRVLHDRWDETLKSASWAPRAPLKVGAFQVFGSGWVQVLLQGANHLGFLIWRVLLVGVFALLLVLVLPIWDDLPVQLWGFLKSTVLAMGMSFVAFLPNLGRIVLIVLVVRLGLAVLKYIFGEIRKGRIRLRNFDRTWAQQTYNLIRFAAIVLAAIFIFPLLPGSGSTGFQGIAIFVGALVSLGATTAVANAVAGIVLTYTKAFTRGDRVLIQEILGDVVARTTFVTRIRTVKNEEISLPNQLVLAGPIINYSRDAGGKGVAVEVRIGLGYDVEWRDVHRLLKESAALDGVLNEPEPRVYQAELGDFAVSYTLYALVEDPTTMLSVRSKIIQRIMDLFAQAGIEILSPDHLAVRDGKPGIPTTSKAFAPPSPDEDVVEPDVPSAEAVHEDDDSRSLDLDADAKRTRGGTHLES